MIRRSFFKCIAAAIAAPFVRFSSAGEAKPVVDALSAGDDDWKMPEGLDPRKRIMWITPDWVKGPARVGQTLYEVRDERGYRICTTEYSPDAVVIGDVCQMCDDYGMVQKGWAKRTGRSG